LKASEFVKQAKYIPLPRHGYDAAIDRVMNCKLGTLFGGEAAIGISIADLVKRETKM